MKFVKIDPFEADRLRSSGHTPEEKKERHERAKGLIREMKPLDPQLQELHDRKLNPDKYLSREEKERRERESA